MYIILSFIYIIKLQSDVAHREGNTSNKDQQGDEREPTTTAKTRKEKKNTKRKRSTTNTTQEDDVVEDTKTKVNKPPPARRQRHMKYSIGAHVSKVFGDPKTGKERPFSGTIVSYDNYEKLYKVRYEDGDEEELDEGDIGKIIVKVGSTKSKKKGKKGTLKNDKSSSTKPSCKVKVEKGGDNKGVVVSAATLGIVAVVSSEEKEENDVVIKKEVEEEKKEKKIRKIEFKGVMTPYDDIDDPNEMDHPVTSSNDDPSYHCHYVDQMYEHFRSKEAATSTRMGYMDTIQRPNSVNSSLINARMRGILIDWLIEVHLKFKLAPDTLYLTVNIIDRYLDTTLVTRPRLQLVGVTAFMIATKYEEVYPPELRDLVYICDGSYTRLEILDMEERILTKLKYNVTVPTAHAFLVRYLKAAHASHRIVHLSCYILDGTLTCYKLLKYLPSQLAAAAVLIARKNSPDFRNWSPTLQAYTKYTEEELVPVARAILAEKAATPPSWKSVKTKYTSTKFGEVALLNIPSDFWNKKGFELLMTRYKEKGGLLTLEVQ